MFTTFYPITPPLNYFQLSVLRPACVITLLINCRQLMLWLLALIRRRAARRPKISCLRWSPQIKIPPSVHVKGYLKPGCLAKKNFMTLAKTFFLQSQASDKIAPEKKSYLLESCWNEKKPPSKSFFCRKKSNVCGQQITSHLELFWNDRAWHGGFLRGFVLVEVWVRLPGPHGLQ